MAPGAQTPSAAHHGTLGTWKRRVRPAARRQERARLWRAPGALWGWDGYWWIGADPSAFCGLTGLKVTEGVLPLDGIQPLSHTLDTPGPMCRNVIDAAIMYETMAGREPHLVDADLKNGTGLYGEIKEGIVGLNLGVITDKSAP